MSERAEWRNFFKKKSVDTSTLENERKTIIDTYKPVIRRNTLLIQKIIDPYKPVKRRRSDQAMEECFRKKNWTSKTDAELREFL